MKTFLFIFTLLFCTVIHSQIIPFPLADNTTWTVYSLSFEFDDEIITTYENCTPFHTGNDTIINGKTYTIINSTLFDNDEGFRFALREENGAIWMQPYGLNEWVSWIDETKEFLVFDFNLNDGDSFTFYNSFFSETPDTTVSIVEVENFSNPEIGIIDRKQFSFPDLNWPCGFKWLEGIGGTPYHPFYWLAYCHDGSNSFDKTTYSNCLEIEGEDPIGDCDCMPGPIVNTDEAYAHQDSRFFPNPTSGNLYVELISEQSEWIRIRLYHLDGTVKMDSKEMFYPKQKISINLLELGIESGIYFVSIQNENGIFTERIIYQK